MGHRIPVHLRKWKGYVRWERSCLSQMLLQVQWSLQLAKGAPWGRRRQMLLHSGSVDKVKQRYHWMNETLFTKGPRGTVSHKTQISLQLLIKEMDRLRNNIWVLNPAYEEFVDLTNLLTTQVDNLHAVSHFKHESFSVLQYAQDFVTIVKESMKRTTKWSAKYYTHDRSYYPHGPTEQYAPSVVSFMTPLPCKCLDSERNVVSHQAVKTHRPVRKRTVRSETTKG